MKEVLKKIEKEDLNSVKKVLYTIYYVLDNERPPYILYIPFVNFPKDLNRDIIQKWVKFFVDNGILTSGGKIIGSQTDGQQIELRVDDDRNNFDSFLQLVDEKSKKLKGDIGKNKDKIFDDKLKTPFGDFRWLIWLKRFKGFKKIILTIIIVIIAGVFFQLYIFLKDKPSFSYTMSSSAFDQKNIADTEFPIKMVFWGEGTIRSTFSQKRTLERIDYVFWDNKKIGSTYGGGYLQGDIYDLGVEEDRVKIKLPIFFEENEAKKIALSFAVDIESKDDLYNKFSYICKGIYCHWDTNSELIFKDNMGNSFDESGKLMSEGVEKSWWLLPNNKDFFSSLLAKMDIYKDIVIWKIRAWLYLYK
ncbi:hypothetical protein K8R42_04315 [bacterium]|nr:hypothetical protein [bacterium]